MEMAAATWELADEEEEGQCFPSDGYISTNTTVSVHDYLSVLQEVFQLI